MWSVAFQAQLFAWTSRQAILMFNPLWLINNTYYILYWHSFVWSFVLLHWRLLICGIAQILHMLHIVTNNSMLMWFVRAISLWNFILVSFHWQIAFKVVCNIKWNMRMSATHKVTCQLQSDWFHVCWFIHKWWQYKYYCIALLQWVFYAPAASTSCIV